MSLFDCIRYPISVPPLCSELEALPRELFDKWGLTTFESNVSPQAVARIYQIIHEEARDDTTSVRMRENMLKSCEQLRKMIADWDAE